MRNPEALRQVGRLFIILQCVAHTSPPTQLGRIHLADACSCSTKTIQRDIDLLQEMGVPLRYDSSARTYALADKGWCVTSIQLTTSDLLALALLKAWFGREGSAFPFSDQITRVLGKSTSALPTRQHQLFEDAVAAVASVGGPARDYSAAPTAQIHEAIVRQETIEMQYESRSSAPGRRELRRVDPYRLDLRDGRYLELQAFCHARRAVRTFAVDRIFDIDSTKERFQRHPTTLDDEGVISGLRGGEPVAVDVHFDAETASYAREHRWGFQASFQTGKDGSARMAGTVLGTDGIVKELLRWGSHAQVLGGAELRERMVEEVRSMAKIYENLSNCFAQESRIVSLPPRHNADQGALE